MMMANADPPPVPYTCSLSLTHSLTRTHDVALVRCDEVVGVRVVVVDEVVGSPLKYG